MGRKKKNSCPNRQGSSASSSSAKPTSTDSSGQSRSSNQAQHQVIAASSAKVPGKGHDGRVSSRHDSFFGLFVQELRKSSVNAPPGYMSAERRRQVPEALLIASPDGERRINVHNLLTILICFVLVFAVLWQSVEYLLDAIRVTAACATPSTTTVTETFYSTVTLDQGEAVPTVGEVLTTTYTTMIVATFSTVTVVPFPAPVEDDTLTTTLHRTSTTTQTVFTTLQASPSVLDGTLTITRAVTATTVSTIYNSPSQSPTTSQLPAETSSATATTMSTTTAMGPIRLANVASSPAASSDSVFATMGSTTPQQLASSSVLSDSVLSSTTAAAVSLDPVSSSSDAAISKQLAASLISSELTSSTPTMVQAPLTSSSSTASTVSSEQLVITTSTSAGPDLTVSTLSPTSTPISSRPSLPLFLNTTTAAAPASPTLSSSPANVARSTTSTECGEIGPFVLTFDDLPAFSASNQSDVTQQPPIFSPYRHLSFSNGYVYAPDASEPFTPISSPNVAVFLAETSGLKASGTTQPGEIGDGPRESNSTYWFDAHSAWLGCDNRGPDKCTIVLTGYTWDAGANEETATYQQNTTLAPCANLKGCNLQLVTFPASFRSLSGLQIQAFVEEQEKMFFVDNLSLAWSDDSCAAGLARSAGP